MESLSLYEEFDKLLKALSNKGLDEKGSELMLAKILANITEGLENFSFVPKDEY